MQYHEGRAVCCCGEPNDPPLFFPLNLILLRIYLPVFISDSPHLLKCFKFLSRSTFWHRRVILASSIVVMFSFSLGFQIYNARKNQRVIRITSDFNRLIFYVNIGIGIGIAIALVPKFFSGSTTINQELSTLAAGGTPWKGRLRSHHTTPQSFPVQRLPSQTNNLGEEEDLQTSKKQAAPKKTVRGCQARAVRQSLRLNGRDSKHPIVIDNEVNEVGAALA